MMILEQLKKIIESKLSIDKKKISLETRLKEDLGLDSFDAVDLVIQIEETFKIKISDETMQQFQTIKDVVFYIENNLFQ